MDGDDGRIADGSVNGGHHLQPQASYELFYAFHAITMLTWV
jgi:hypothetical protein